MNNGVVWIRVSSEAQVSGYSLDNQERQIEEYVKRKKITVVKSYRVQESAKESHRRKNFQEMISFVEHEKIKFLIAYDHDRLARNYTDFYKIQTLIDRSNVTVVSVNDNKEINKDSSVNDRFMFQIAGALAESENRRRADKTRAGLKEKVEQGWFPAMCPIGYLNVPDAKDLKSDESQKRRIIVPDPIRAPLVYEAFKLYASGNYSIDSLREEMSRRGLRNKSTARIPDGPLTRHGVEKMLKNRFYIGEFQWGNEIYEGKHEPIIKKDLFNCVQKKIFLNRTYSKPNSKKWFLFKRFLKCGYCGSSMIAENQSGRHGKGNYNYYHCSKTKKRDCPQIYLREEKIDDLLKNAIEYFYIDDNIANRIIKELKESNLKKDSYLKNEIKRLTSLKTQKMNIISINGPLYEDRLNAIISGEEFKEKRDRIHQEVEMIDQQMGELFKNNDNYQNEGSLIIDLLQDAYKAYTEADSFGKSEILGTIIKTCRVKGKAGEESSFEWLYPFNYLFSIGRILKAEQGGVIKKEKWGE